MNASHNDLPKPRLSIPSIVRETVNTLLFVVAIMVLFDLALPRSLVDGQSMEPTFHNNDRLIISRVNYLIDHPKRGDIVVFNAVVPYDAEQGIMLIKRVIGLPGETVEIRNQHVWIDDVQLDESYTLEACWDDRCTDAKWILGDDEYFVMGDNRNHSNDSRSFDAVPFDHIVGQVIFRYWPLTTIGMRWDHVRLQSE